MHSCAGPVRLLSAEHKPVLLPMLQVVVETLARMGPLEALMSRSAQLQGWQQQPLQHLQLAQQLFGPI